MRFSTRAAFKPDNGAGLTKGIIGLATKGSRESRMIGARCGRGRGALRAVSTTWKPIRRWTRKRVGIEGVSRYGKAALVTMAFDYALRGGAGGFLRGGRRQTAPAQFREKRWRISRGPASTTGWPATS